jgi:hypothetical protein
MKFDYTMDTVLQALIGTASLVFSVAGSMIGQIDGSAATGFVGIVSQFGGLGLAVWLVYHHTTVSMPNKEKEYKEERLLTLELHTKQLEDMRRDFLLEHKHVAEKFAADVQQEREKFLQAFRSAECRFKSN